jgi:hypothetical protein
MWIIIILIIIFIVGLILIVSEGYTPADEAADILEEKMRLDEKAHKALTDDNDVLYSRVNALRDALSASTESAAPGKNDDSCRWTNRQNYEAAKSSLWIGE